MATSPRFGFTIEELSGSDADLPRVQQNLIDRLEAVGARFDVGPFADRPPANAASRGLHYYAEDQRLEYVCTGTVWRQTSTWTRRVGADAQTSGTSWHWPVGQEPRPILNAPFAGVFEVTVGATFLSLTSESAYAYVSFDGSTLNAAGGFVPPETLPSGDQGFATYQRTVRRTLAANQALAMAIRVGSTGSTVMANGAFLEITPVQEF